MKTTYTVKGGQIVGCSCVVDTNFKHTDDVYFDPTDGGIHVKLIDPAYVGENVRVFIDGGETIFIGGENEDVVVDGMDTEKFEMFVMSETDRIELSYKKTISSVTEGVASYDNTATSTRLIAEDGTRYNELIAAA